MRYKEFENYIEDWEKKYDYNNLDWRSYRNLSENEKKELFEIVTEFAKTPPEDREDEKRFRFEISAFTEIDIKARDLNEARKRADIAWHETFENGLFGDVEFIKELDIED